MGAMFKDTIISSLRSVWVFKCVNQVCMCACVCMCVYVCMCVHVCVCVHVSVCSERTPFPHPEVRICLRVCMCV